ncbi:putative NAC domain-containing protein [Quillaja saponaria]|uniref:NAC domain-containing protein n=1 Tax=Quillaja saponaria TaxID=32244 RepID=A0AAD7PYP9_QUISA|nr:putative NAC domain-containing protein [Quillaja saponaria]
MENMNLAPTGFRFYPTEEELVSFYLHNKLEGNREDLNRVLDRVIPVANIYAYNPWDLPQISGEVSYGDTEQWFFFFQSKTRSEARGGRPNRLTITGYWKATGSPNHVYSSNNRIIGSKKTMVFCIGRAPNGTKTEWKMNEYKTIKGDASSSSSSSAIPMVRQELSLCQVYKKSKCLRAFDRRPPPREEAGYIGSTDQQAYQRVGGSTSTYHHYPPMVEIIATVPGLSESSTSSANQGHPSHHSTTGEGNTIDVYNNEPMLDLQQLDGYDEPMPNWEQLERSLLGLGSSIMGIQDENSRVKDFVQDDLDWDRRKIAATDPTSVCDKIFALLPPCEEEGKDTIAWGRSWNGSFTTQTTYQALKKCNDVGKDKIWKVIWDWDGPYRIQAFIGAHHRDKKKPMSKRNTLLISSSLPKS